MPYRVIFSGQTNPEHQLCEKGVLVASVPLFDEENLKINEKIKKFNGALSQLKMAAGGFDFLSTDLLLRHNFEILGQEQVQASDSALDLAKTWAVRYDVKRALAESGCMRSLSWSAHILEHASYAVLSRAVAEFYQHNTYGFMQKVVKIAADRLAFLSGKRLVDPIKALSKSIDYILEESVAVLVLRLMGEYQCLFYIQGKLNEATYDMATRRFDLTTALFDKINQCPLTVVTVSRFDLAPVPFLSSSHNNLLLFPSEKQQRVDASKKQTVSTHSAVEDQPSLRERVSLATRAFFDSAAIPLKNKEEFLRALLLAADQKEEALSVASVKL